MTIERYLSVDEFEELRPTLRPYAPPPHPFSLEGRDDYRCRLDFFFFDDGGRTYWVKEAAVAVFSQVPLYLEQTIEENRILDEEWTSGGNPWELRLLSAEIEKAASFDFASRPDNDRDGIRNEIPRLMERLRSGVSPCRSSISRLLSIFEARQSVLSVGQGASYQLAAYEVGNRKYRCIQSELSSLLHCLEQAG